MLKAKSDWELKDVVATAKKNKMYELLHEIPSDIVQVNQHETEKTRVAHIEDFSAEDFLFGR